MYTARDMMSILEVLKLKLSDIIKEGANKEELLLRNCEGTVKSLDFNLEMFFKEHWAVSDKNLYYFWYIKNDIVLKTKICRNLSIILSIETF